MIHFITGQRPRQFLAAILRHGQGRRHCVWTEDITGALGFDDIDIPLARAIVTALGDRHRIVSEVLPNGTRLETALSTLRDVERSDLPASEVEAFVRSMFDSFDLPAVSAGEA